MKNTTQKTFRQLIRNILIENYSLKEDLPTPPEGGEEVAKQEEENKQVILIEEFQDPGTSENRKLEIYKIFLQKYRNMIFNQIRKYEGGLRGAIGMEDLRNAGNRGIWEGLSKYDTERKSTVSTFFFYQIRSKIYETAQQAQQVRLPGPQQSLKNTINRYKQKHYAGYGIEPTEEEIVGNIKWPTYYQRFDFDKKLQIVRDLETWEGTSSSMDTTMSPTGGEDGEREFGPAFKDFAKSDVRADTLLVIRDKTQAFKDLFSVLKPRDADIIYQYFLTQGEGKSNKMRELAQKYGVTVPRISTIISNGVEKIKTHPRIKELENILRSSEELQEIDKKPINPTGPVRIDSESWSSRESASRRGEIIKILREKGYSDEEIRKALSPGKLSWQPG